MKKFILIDSHALIHRAYHALPPLTTKSGELVNAVYGFTSILIKTISDFKPDYIAAAFDAPGATFRHEEYKEYKATRVKAPDDLYAQIPRVKEILTAFNIPIFEKSGFEADDIIGTISKNLKRKDIEVLILTGDTDNFQLIGKNIKVLYSSPSASKEQIIYDAKRVEERFEGLKPEQLIDFKGLKGDPSDNIPGIKGVGEKTAIILLQRFGTIENLYRAVEKNKINGVSASVLEKLKTGKDMAFFSKKLATIKQNVSLKFDLKKSQFGKFNKEKLFNILRELGFVSLIDRLSAKGGQTAKQARLPEPAAQAAGGQGMLLMPSAPTKKIKHFKVPQEISFINLLKELSGKKEIYLAYRLTEIGDLSSLAIDDGKNTYLIEKEFSNVGIILENENIKKIGHDLKPLIKSLWRLNIDLKGINFDTTIAAYIFEPGKRSYEIKKLAAKEFGENLPDESKENLIAEANIIGRLKPVLSKKLIATETEKVFKEIEMPLIPVLARMEFLGIKVDSQKLKALKKNLDKELKRTEEKIYKLAGEKFNINSPQQLSEILFLKLKISGALKGGRIRKTPGGALSTEASELEKLRPHHKIVDYILKYREVAKLKSTYTDSLIKLTDGNGRVHTTFNQVGTASGRLSSQEPNLQNIPARGGWGDEVRKSFIAEKRYKLLSVDYSQIHLRIIAALANDKKMMEAFKKKLDIHKFTAAEINNIPTDKVTSEMRFAAKALNFGIIYGMGAQSFAESANISKERAKEFISEYLKDFSGVAQYIKKLQEEARKRGYTVTLFGRRRYLPELNFPNYMLRSQAERIAINMPIQGLEADIVKKAMTEVSNWIQKGDYADKIRMLLQVHDELLFEVKENLVAEAASKIAELMESVIKLRVPIITETKVGDNWGELKKYAGTA